MLVVFAGPAACSRGEASKRSTANGALAKADTEPPVIPPVPAPYREESVPNGGTIAGTVTFAGDAPGDTVVHPTVDQDVCGAQLRDGGIVHSGNRLGETVVWLADIRGGKPVPLERRFAVENDDCKLVPRVQAALVGGTVNVGSEDAAVHRTRFVRQGANETVATVTEHDEGQVVPVSDILAQPGLLAITCDNHPWTRGWIAVFDHPYFAVTAADGTFTLDQVPPGDYTLLAWHPRFGKVERRVHVDAGGRATADVQLGASTGGK